MNEQYEIRQFKLTSGEEILCEIVQWNNEEELELVVKKPMKLVMGELETGVRFYSFRPWLVYQENPDDFIILNGHHIVGIGFPPDSLLKQYDEAVVEMASMHEQREKEFHEKYSTTSDDIKEMTRKVKKSSEDIEQYLRRLKDLDSDFTNVIQFDPTKVH